MAKVSHSWCGEPSMLSPDPKGVSEWQLSALIQASGPLELIQ